MAERSPLWPGLAIAIMVAALDQASKWWILLSVMRPPREIEVTSFFNLVMGWNTGVSFGILTQSSAWILTAVALAVVVGLLVWLRKAETRLVAVAIGMIIGGAVGNVFDRLYHGAVLDFLDVHAGSGF